MNTDDLLSTLDSFDAQERASTLHAMHRMGPTLLSQGKAFNLHCHSFYSYNGYGYSPSSLAWRGRAAGLYAMGLVDFDVLDGVEEFLAACHDLGLRACAGLESRVFVPEFASRGINSPGEPGIAYHMGVGFVSQSTPMPDMLARFKAQAQARNLGLIARVNAFLTPVAVDYENDVLPLTPAGNATERHICTAYDHKAQAHFPERAERLRFWSEKLRVASESLDAVLDNAPTFQGIIRGKTMKQGGPGYVRPEGGDFPTLAEMNQFILACEAIPTFAWLDGTSEGEQALDELLDTMTAAGVEMVNIIPDRNWNIADPDEKQRKVENLYRFVEAANARDLPIMVGTEMNAYGQRFVDDFNAPELASLHPVFLRAVHILHAHTQLQQAAGMGCTSAWAREHFASRRERNTFYETLGARLVPGDRGKLTGITPATSPSDLLSA